MRVEATRQRALLAGTFGTRQKVEQADAQEKRFAATLARNLADLDGQRQQLAVLDTQELQGIEFFGQRRSSWFSAVAIARKSGSVVVFRLRSRNRWGFLIAIVLCRFCIARRKGSGRTTRP
jgi:hypothetical protein